MPSPSGRAATVTHKHAIAYVRCSSTKQAEKESSIPAQRREIERRAEQDGYTVVKWFEDDGISGKNIEDRPGMEALLTWVSRNKGAVDRFYVYDSKRMARNRADAFGIRKDLHKAHIQLVAIAQPSVEDEAANALLESMWDGLAEMERIQLAKVVKRGQQQALLDGWWPYPPSRAPYGFRVVGQANTRGVQRGKLVPDPEQAEVVRHIFDLYLGGDGFKAVASRLDQEGIPAPGRSDIPKERILGWQAKHVRLIVASPVCWGAATWKDEVINETHHPGIIDREMWEKAQGTRAARTRTPKAGSLGTTKSDHGLFRPWLKCAGCGGPMTLNRGGTPTNRIWYYACSTRLHNKAACQGLTVRADDLDTALLDAIESEVLTEASVHRLIESTLERMREDAGGELRERRAELEARIEDCSRKLKRIAASVAEGTLALEDVGELSTPLRNMRDQARDWLARLPEPQPVPTIEQVNPQVFRESILASWRATDIRVRRKALDRIVWEVVLHPGKALVRYAWKAEPTGYTYQEPYGPPNGSPRVFELWVMVAGLAQPKHRAA